MFFPSVPDDVEDSFYECTHCRTRLDRWTADCPDCSGLVVRVVDGDGG